MLINQFQITEKRKYQCKESGHLAVWMLEYTPLLFMWVHWTSVRSPLSTHQFLLLLSVSDYRECRYRYSGSKILKKEREVAYYWKHNEIQTYRFFPEHLLGYKIFHVYLQLTSLLLCSWHKMDPFHWKLDNLTCLVGGVSTKINEMFFMQEETAFLTTKLGLFLETQLIEKKNPSVLETWHTWSHLMGVFRNSL